METHNISAWAQYTIRVRNRDQLQQKLHDVGIPTAVHYPIPLYRQPAVIDSSVVLPIVERITKEVMSLPMHSYLIREELLKVVELLVEFSKQ